MSKRKAEEEPQETTQNEIISNLKFSQPLNNLNEMERAECPLCKKARKYYCYSCMTPMGDVGKIPQIELPMKVVVLQHSKELKSKSTAIHAKAIAPKSVEIFEYPALPDYINSTNAVLLYPGKNAITVPELVEKNKQETTTSKIEYVVFIDSTWQQSKSIFRDPVVASLPNVKIADQKTLFWRYQQHGDSYLATIEAIYFFFKEFNANYQGEYDDLMYFYAHQYELIQNKYRNDTSKEFIRKQGYINYDNTNKKAKK